MVPGNLSFHCVRVSRIRDHKRLYKKTELRLHPAEYRASKAAAINLKKQVAVDHAPHRMHCNALCPGCKRILLSLQVITICALCED